MRLRTVSVVGLVALTLALLPMPRADVAGQVAGNTYTSPQFGYQVKWEAPWALTEISPNPASEPGAWDSLGLSAEPVEDGAYYVVRGFFTNMDTAAFLEQYVADLINWLGQQTSAPATSPATSRTGSTYVDYTADGRRFTVAIDVTPLVPGESVVATSLGFPFDTPGATVDRLLSAVRLVLPDDPSSTRSQAPTQAPSVAANPEEDRACDEFARLLQDIYADMGGLPAESIAILGGCRQTETGDWFLPTGPDDPRLPGGPPLTPLEAERTAALRETIVAQIAEFAQTLATVVHPGLPGGGGKTLLDAVSELYDSVKHAQYGNRKPDIRPIYGVEEWYGEMFYAYLTDPSHRALGNYVTWWGLRRQAAFPESVCLQMVPLYCDLAKDALGLNDWPWPWDLTDLLTLDEHLDWALANGYVPPASTRASTTTPANADCAAIAIWLEGTFERLQDVSLSLPQGDPPPFPSSVVADDFDRTADYIAGLAQGQAASAPPPGGLAINALLVQAWEGFVNGYRKLAEAERSGDRSAWDEGWQMMSEAYRYEQEASALIPLLQAECGLAATPLLAA